MFTFLHSCGHIVAILDDLIEIGLDAIHMDQQENMGLELLGQRFGGRLTFFSPVDIQTAMHRSLDEVRAYARKMVRLLGRPEGGILPRWYTDRSRAILCPPKPVMIRWLRSTGCFKVDISSEMIHFLVGGSVRPRLSHAICFHDQALVLRSSNMTIILYWIVVVF